MQAMTIIFVKSIPFLMNFQFLKKGILQFPKCKISCQINYLQQTISQICWYQQLLTYKQMIEYCTILVLIIALFIYYRFYYKPKAEIKRYVKILQGLGYKVYEQPFAFLGISFAKEFQVGLKKYKDAQYFERTVHTQVDICIGNILDNVQINLINPDLIKQFLSPNAMSIYPKFELMVCGTKAAFGEGLVFSEGEQWKNKRKLMSKVFNFDLIKENISKISQICDRCLDTFDQKYRVQGNTVKYNVTNLSARLFNGVMMKCFFGSDQIKDEIKGVKYEEFVIKTISEAAQLTLDPLMVFMGKLAWKIGLTSKIKRIKENIFALRQKATEVLKKRIDQVTNSDKRQKITDIIQALVYQKLANKQSFEYSDQDLVDEFQTFSIAGTDTTTRFFTMIIYYLGKNPRVLQKLREQINSIIKSDKDITYQNLKLLTYIDWIQFETTRLYGPANLIFWRIANADNLIKDVPIRKGTVVDISVRGNHYSQNYFKNPNEFRPQRWESQCDNIHPYASLGFSAGPRNCIGKQLAHLESKIALVKVIQRYQNIEVPEQISMVFTFLYQPESFDTKFTKNQDIKQK